MLSRNRRVGLLILAIAGAAGLLVVQRSMLRTSSPPRANVILIVLDTLRADRLGRYGNANGLTPFLDRFADTSTVYERAYAQSSWTVPSVASLLLAQYPSEHQVVVYNAVLPDDVLTLPEVLHQHGYRTGGFSANLQISADSGFAQGFDDFRVLFVDPKDDATSVNRAAIEWLDTLPAQHTFLLYLQYMEAHSPYRPHEGLTASRDAAATATSDADLNQRVTLGSLQLRDRPGVPDAWKFDPAEVQRLQQLYDGEVRYLDRCLADLFTGLERRNALRNTIVIITADHGEEFGEHQMFSHGTSLFETAIHIPLIMRLPSPQPHRITAPVQLAGLAPALFNTLDIPIPESFHVAQLPTREPTGDTDGRTAAYSGLVKTDPRDVNVFHRRALVTSTEKLLIQQDGAAVFYDLSNDPAEQHGLTAPPFAKDLVQAMQRVTDQIGAAIAPPAAPVDDTTRERLRALGYTQ